MNVNFFWQGNDFQFLNRLTLISHVGVGHKVKVWLNGNIPDSIYWIDDIPEIEILNANNIVQIGETDDVIRVRVDSTLWSYYLLKKTGEYYADTDAIAWREWPDEDIVLASSDNDYISVGVIRLPKNHVSLDDCISSFRETWGNVKRFTHCVRRHGLDNTVPEYIFYPIDWRYNTSKVLNCHCRLLDPPNKELRDKLDNEKCVSIHYYSTRSHKVGINHSWLKREVLQNSLFKMVFDRTQQNYKWNMTNENTMV